VPRRSRPLRRPPRTLAALVATAITVAGLATAVPEAGAAPPTTPFISEIHYDNTGTDSGELVEVELPPGTTSTGWSIVLYNGSGGITYDTDALPAVTAPADASAVALVSYPSNGLQNGSPDGVALVRPDLTVAEFLSYEGTITATNGPAIGTTSTDIGVSELGTEVVGNTLMRRYNPATDAVEWQGSAPGTPGTLNPPLDGGTVDPCDVPATHEIGAVQGSGFSTPIASEVTVAGVVVADVPLLGGFYLQDPDGDGAATTSDGIFVASSSAVGLGDSVAVTGTPGENFGETRVTASAVSVCTPAPPDPLTTLPAAAPLDLPSDAAAREPLEGMLVAPVDVLTVSEVFALTRFGELTLSEGGLLVQPTELARPGSAEAQAVAASNALRHLILDDGSNASTSATNRPYLTIDLPVRVGDELTFTAPVVLGFGFGSWRLQPADGTPDGTFALQNTRPAAPDAVGGDITIAAFNVLNYFLTLGPPGRGATSAPALERQAAKIVTAILALDADIVTLMEIEDSNSTGLDGGSGNADLALADLVGRLNAVAGPGTYAYSPFPDELLAVDRDVIRSAIIYRPAAVTPVGDSVGLVDETVWFNAREPIAQTFEAQGDVFTVVANHFKSKTPGAPTGDNVDTGDGQGEWNGDRRRQAASLLAFVGQLQAATGDTDVLLMGDFNAYTQEDPIDDMRTAGFTDVGSLFDPERYSYVFDELSGSLDHGLASASLLAKVTEAVHWNINAVESFSYQYTGDPAFQSPPGPAPTPYRSSDHDPLVIGLDLATPTLSIADAPSVTEGTAASFTVTLSAPTAIAPVTVEVTTAPGTATAPGDYTETTTTATFAPGSTTATVTVPTVDDALDELDETFTASLGAVTGPATVADGGGTGTGTIVDNDPSPTVRAFDALVVEGNTGTRVVRVPVRLSTASGRTVTVAWATQALTASAGSDFVAASGTVTFAPGQTQGFADVTIIGDRRRELIPELFQVRLSAPSGATVAGSPGLVLILDDDLFR
jgi:predicted extracellular nuclease